MLVFSYIQVSSKTQEVPTDSVTDIGLRGKLCFCGAGAASVAVGEAACEAAVVLLSAAALAAAAAFLREVPFVYHM